MRPFALTLLLAAAAAAQTITIDCGAASDQFFAGVSFPYTIATPGAAGDLTARYGAPRYAIPAPPGPYDAVLYFRELGTVAAAGERLFSVAINGQPVLSDFDLFAAAGLNPISRTFPATSTGLIGIEFSYSKRSAVISRIELIPRPPAPPPPAISAGPGILIDANQTISIDTAFLDARIAQAARAVHFSGIAPAKQTDGTYVLTAPNPAQPVSNLAVFRNGLRMKEAFDYKVGQALITPTPAYIVIAPITPWELDDTVLCDFDQIAPPLAAARFPIPADVAARWIAKWK